jgi:putative adenylate-forming enzyme
MIRSIRHTRRIAFFLRANNALYESVNNLWVDFRFYDLQIPLDRYLKALSEFSPLILIAPAQTLQLIAKAQRELDRFSISPKQIVSVAEVLDPQDKAFIEETFGIAVDQIYQCTEGLLACTCPHGSLHLNEDAIIIEKEWIDKDSGRFVPVITDLRRQSQPIVRYRLDDVLVVDEEPCSCGSSLTRLKFIEGRCDDMLVFNSARKTEKDNNHRFVFADIIRRTLLKVDGLADYRVIQDAPEALSLFLSPFNEDTQASTQSHIHALCEAQEVKVPDCAFFPLDNESQQLKDKDLMTKRRRIVKNFAHGE